VRSYGPERREAACQRGMDICAQTYGSVQSILRNGLDRACRPEPVPDSCPSSTGTSAAAATTIEEHVMLAHPTTDRLRELGPAGMARALEEQRRHADAADPSSEDRLAMPVEREALERDTAQSPQDATADHVWPSRLPGPPSTGFVRGMSHDQPDRPVMGGAAVATLQSMASEKRADPGKS
jgi:hypothetical protein